MGCGASCGGSMWQKQTTPVCLYRRSRWTGPPARFVGFGFGLCDAPIVCGDNDPNPAFTSATVSWADFRFYGEIDRIGVVRGDLNSARESGVLLRARTTDGLFPADFLNQLFLTLTVKHRPFLRYENRIAFQMHADSAISAPPPEDFIAYQVKESDVFLRTIPIPFAPRVVELHEGVQKFIPNGDLQIVDAFVNSARLTFSIRNLLDEPTLVAWFVHSDSFAGSHRLPDGVCEISANGTRVIRTSLPIESGPGNQITVRAVVLGPQSVEGADIHTISSAA